ncbi:hypothetical protein AD951_02705 [Acetobacter malorum]|uniref:Uncharacterized protein n=1 Tax=Acetobacter malorum TaxID=178901 RepID=A0A149US23_9PROT|nr:hypothetical protein [Acetobacter malorum]KXV70536.1 hypothetical protein AD951_02705 [Acetobacter malorum]
MTQMLFPLPSLPRRKRVKRMHVADAGHLPGGAQKGIRFVCSHCGYDTGWIQDTRSISDNRKGLPCPACNP